MTCRSYKTRSAFSKAASFVTGPDSSPHPSTQFIKVSHTQRRAPLKSREVWASSTVMPSGIIQRNAKTQWQKLCMFQIFTKHARQYYWAGLKIITWSSHETKVQSCMIQDAFFQSCWCISGLCHSKVVLRPMWRSWKWAAWAKGHFCPPPAPPPKVPTYRREESWQSR